MTVRNGLKYVSSLAFMLSAGTALVAQVTTGSLAGKVTNPQGQPVAGARVTLTSPALFNARVLTTNEAGEWRAPLLPVGNYRIVVAKEGFVGGEATGVRVGIGTAARQDMSVRPVQQAQAVVEVVASGETVDKSETKSATNFSAETLQVLPGVNRSFSGAADLAAGVATGASGQFSVRGGATQQTLFRLNGADIRDDYQGAQVGTYVIQDNIEDVQVIVSPLHARSGRATGGAVNVVTKTGSNTFAGSIRATYSRPSWNATNPAYLYRQGETVDTPTRQYDVTFSGPIIPDRLWFSVGTILRPSQSSVYELGNSSPNATRVARTRNATIDAATLAGPGGGYVVDLFNRNLTYTQQRDNPYFEGKITGAITPNHTLELSGSWNKTTIEGRNPFGNTSTLIRRLEALGDQEDKQSTMVLGYRGLLSGDTFLSAMYTRKKSEAIFPTGDPNYGTGEVVDVWLDQASSTTLQYNRVGYPFGLGITPRPDARNNTSFNAEMKLYREFWGGSHDIDLGVDYYQFDRGTSRSLGAKNQYFRTGGAYYNATSNSYLFPTIIWTGPGRFGQSGSGNTGLAPIMIEYTGQDGTTENTMQSVYANDAWTINSHWNVMLGLRYDWIEVTDIDGSTKGKSGDLSPRVQVRWDPTGDARHVFTFTAARFGGDFTAGFTDAFISSADSAGANWGWSGIAGQPLPGTTTDPMAGLRFVDYATLTNPANYKGAASHLAAGLTKYSSFDNSKNNVIDGDLSAEMLDELTVEYRRTFSGGSFLRTAYIYRNWVDQWAFAQDWAPDQFVAFQDPDLNRTSYYQTTRIFNSNDLKRVYQGLEVEFQTKLNKTWTLGGNYTFSRLVGNHNGGDSTSSFRENGVPGYYGNRRHLKDVMGLSDDVFAPVGRLLNDQTHRARLHLSAVVPLGKGQISYSWLLRYDSGGVWSAASAAPFTPALPSYLNMASSRPLTYTKFYGGRGQYSYNDTYQVDFKMSWQLPLGLWRVMLIGDVQVDNLFNTIIQGSYSTALAPTGSFGANALYLDASIFGTPRSGSGINYWTNGRSVGASIGVKF